MNPTSTTPPTSLLTRTGAFLDLIKFAHTIFALPFALVGAAFAWRELARLNPSFTLRDLFVQLGLILACMVTARTYAMTVNRLVDRRFDALNPRTAKRPSVTGAISPLFMLIALILCATLFTVFTFCFYALYQNPWPALLAIPVLLWLGLYSLTKRFTALCHFWLGLSLGLAPISAWIALVPPRGPILSLSVILLGAAVLFWVGGFDILYALQDEELDRHTGLHSIPAAVGRRPALWLSRLSHLFTIAALLAVGVTAHLHYLYYLAVLLAAALLLIEQALVKPQDISRINLAFMTLNGLVSLLFSLLALADIYWL